MSVIMTMEGGIDQVVKELRSVGANLSHDAPPPPKKKRNNEQWYPDYVFTVFHIANSAKQD